VGCSSMGRVGGWSVAPWEGWGVAPFLPGDVSVVPLEGGERAAGPLERESSHSAASTAIRGISWSQPARGLGVLIDSYPAIGISSWSWRNVLRRTDGHTDGKLIFKVGWTKCTNITCIASRCLIKSGCPVCYSWPWYLAPSHL
jgi:hypothetical protein